MSGALAGLRVIDCSRLIAGGVLATVLADHGADVIKVENPRGGDPLRTWLRDRGELWWKVYARGKRSITLNLTQPRGQTLLKRLVRDADVLIENFVPGTFEKWGLGWDVLSAENPRLVFARVSGWGQDGPYRDRPGFGTMVEAMSGFAHTTGEAEGPPTLPSFPMADMIAALAGTSAVLAALRHRDQVSGRGQVVDVSLYEPLLSVLGPDAAGYALEGVVRQRHGNTSDNASPRGTYRTLDDKWIALSASTPGSRCRPRRCSPRSASPISWKIRASPPTTRASSTTSWWTRRSPAPSASARWTRCASSSSRATSPRAPSTTSPTSPRTRTSSRAAS
jgi:crotonobetainyl-CoA:carnitine CoA-transferase CaiB-like acyl-CoA transferase